MTDPTATAESAAAGAPEPVRFHRPEDTGQGDLDMTPMVDVTFLLLIFFMVTAAFSLQKSLEVPPPDKQEHAAETRTLEDIEEDDDYIVVRIAEDDSIFVDGIEAPSQQELLFKLREAREAFSGSDSTGPSNLLVLAHGNCHHETVVMAIDTGNAAGMEHVRLATGGEEEF